MKPWSYLWRSFGGRRDSRHLRARLESCVDIVLKLREGVGEGDLSSEILEQFERLRQTLPHVTDNSVDEREISRVEEITNELLLEMRGSVSKSSLHLMHEGKIH